MERFWLKNYPPGVPADIDVTQYRSLPDLMEDSFRTYAHRPAFTFMDHALTYAEVDQLLPFGLAGLPVPLAAGIILLEHAVHLRGLAPCAVPLGDEQRLRQPVVTPTHAEPVVQRPFQVENSLARLLPVGNVGRQTGGRRQ